MDEKSKTRTKFEDEKKKSLDKSEGKTIMKTEQKHVKLNVWSKKMKMFE
jgi:hypothetical protein